MIIASVEDYEAAMARARELMSMNRRDIDEDELVKIGDAVVAWYKRHDDATAWGMKLTPDQITLLRGLLDGPIETAPTGDLILLKMRRLVSRSGFTWTVSKKGEAAIAIG